MPRITNNQLFLPYSPPENNRTIKNTTLYFSPLTHQQHVSQSTSHELITKVQLEVDVVGSVDDGVNELEAGQLKHRVVGLLQGSKDGVKTWNVAQLTVDRHSL